MFQIKKVLCPLDFSEVSLHALNYALAFCEKCDCPLLLLNIVEPIMAPTDFSFGPVTSIEIEDRLLQKAKISLADLLQKIGNHAFPITTRIEKGRPYMEIIRVAREEACNLIVIGTHGYTGLTHALLGSTAEKVVRVAPCPVLTVKPKGYDFIAVEE